MNRGKETGKTLCSQVLYFPRPKYKHWYTKWELFFRFKGIIFALILTLWLSFFLLSTCDRGDPYWSHYLSCSIPKYEREFHPVLLKFKKDIWKHVSENVVEAITVASWNVLDFWTKNLAMISWTLLLFHL